MLNADKTCRSCGRTFSGGETFCPEDGGRLATRSGSFEVTGEDPLIGTVLDSRYRVRRVVGEGGMGIVYEAEHELIERKVALKVLRDDFSRRPDVVERFRREAKSASRIGHPNIVDVLDFGETPAGASYFVMEMLEGEDVADSLTRHGALPADRSVAILVQCCKALGEAHAKGIVHRDLKPENIFLIERDGLPDFVKIVDFGVAKMSEVEIEGASRRKLTRTGMVFGTPEYMSPEQAQGQPPDHRVDIYALGIILFELLTGRVPFEGESFMSVLSKHATGRVPRLRDVNPTLVVSDALEAVVYRALEKVPAERFASMAEMGEALLTVPEMPELLFRTTAAGLLSAPSPALDPTLETDSDRAPTYEIGTTELATPMVTALDVELDGGPSNDRRIGKRVVLALAGVAVGTMLLMLLGRSSDVPSAAAAVDSEGDTPTRGQTPAVADPLVVLDLDGAEAAGVDPGSDDVKGAASLVTVNVTTRPGGASVQLVDGGELCASTPCSFEAVAGEPLSLIARRGLRRARTQLEPGENTKLHLVLLAPAEAAPEVPAAPRATVARKPRPVPSDARHAHDDLKVPAAFRD